MTNVVIWARVSSREQREGYSIDAQLRATRERAQKNGWTVVREFAVAESAKRGVERTAFNEMFDWVRRNARKEKIQSILAHKLDRVCRNMRDAVRLQELEDQCGVQLVFVDNQFGPGAAGMLSFNVMAAVAQYYSDNLRTEVLKGMEEKIKQGWPMGRASYGYKNTPDRENPVVPHPTQALVVQRIFTLYASGEHTFEGLADVLAKEGHVFRQCYRRFNRTTLSYILNNHAYIGEIHRNGQVFPASFPHLIDRMTWNMCQDVLHGRNRRVSQHSHPFNGGLFRCAHCGAAITAEVIRRKLKDGTRREHVYYRCANNNPAPDHPSIRWTQERLEAAIVADLQTIRLGAEAADWLREAITAAFADRERLAKQLKATLTKRQTELKGMLDRLLEAFLGGLIDEATTKAKQGALKVELAEVEAQLQNT